MSEVENVIIVGSGPAGYTAALYTARANLHPLVLEGFAWGGLLQQTTDVENYPGFPDGVMGPEMMQKFRDQAERFGARLLTDDASRVQLASEPGGVHSVWVGDTEHRARTVILAMGAEHKKLCIPGEEELGGRGVSYCATCDAAFFRDSQTIVVGGGDSAMEEAIFLSKFAAKVTLVHRRDEFRASKIMLERARAQPNIEFLTPYTVREFAAGENGALGHATLDNVETGGERVVPVSGAFIAIGHEPQSHLVRGQVDLDENDYVLTDGASTRTSRPGRRSPRRAPAARRPWTPSGTCATRRRCRPPRACPRATWPRPSGPRPVAPERSRRRQRALELQQPALALDASAVAAEGSPAAQHAVTGDHDRHRVGAQRVACCSRATRAARVGCDLGVAEHAAVGDLRGNRQHAAPEGSHEPPVERQLEAAPAAAEVLLQLASHLIQRPARLHDARRDATREPFQHRVRALLGERHPHQSAACGGDNFHGVDKLRPAAPCDLYRIAR